MIRFTLREIEEYQQSLSAFYGELSTYLKNAQSNYTAAERELSAAVEQVTRDIETAEKELRQTQQVTEKNTALLNRLQAEKGKLSEERSHMENALQKAERELQQAKQKQDSLTAPAPVKSQDPNAMKAYREGVAKYQRQKQSLSDQANNCTREIRGIHAQIDACANRLTHIDSLILKIGHANFELKRLNEMIATSLSRLKKYRSECTECRDRLEKAKETFRFHAESLQRVLDFQNRQVRTTYLYAKGAVESFRSFAEGADVAVSAGNVVHMEINSSQDLRNLLLRLKARVTAMAKHETKLNKRVRQYQYGIRDDITRDFQQQADTINRSLDRMLKALDRRLLCLDKTARYLSDYESFPP